MEGSVAEHSDSDSGESWTLLELSPLYAEEAPELPDSLASHERDTPEVNAEKDEDTDGISIISDSEHESSSPCEISLEKYLHDSCPTEQHLSHYISVTPLPTNNIEHESARNEDDFLTENSVKNKTYVHRRNKRLSTVLNIIMLGSVITAAGVAIGHMWGVRNDCSMHTTPSVNKILSNLYKLQEENAYLRSKIKELTLVSNEQLQRKPGTEKLTQKPHRCKKVYEESLNNKITDKITKCVDSSNAENVLESHFMPQVYEKEFLNDIENLKNVYRQNKSWLDKEVTKRIKHENLMIKKNKNVLHQLNMAQDEQMETKNDIFYVENNSHGPLKTKQLETDNSKFVLVTNKDIHEDRNKILMTQKISYADSLKTEQLQAQVEGQKNQNPEEKNHARLFKEKLINKNKRHREGIDALRVSLSDFKFIKDDRYIRPNNKQERKKYDRQKLHKKQKRKNKYEQWEMKGGYMKDYDDISVASSQDKYEHTKINPDPDISQEYKQNNFNKFSEIENSTVLEGNEHKIKRDKYFRNDKGKEKIEIKEFNWFEKRAKLRTEARKNLEKEMFGGNTPNNASWYFRRMQKREQCRAKGDNRTYRKIAKPHMNYKTKH